MEKFEIKLKSYIGDREEQQDNAGSFVNGDTAFAVLCDGMGGYELGAEASLLAVREFSDFFKRNIPQNYPKALLPKTEEINQKVYSLRSGGKRCGTTLVAAVVKDRQLYWISVGDSRLYLYRNGKLTQVTEDHNYFLILNEKMRKGEISAEEYQRESQRGNELISCIGMKKIGRVNMNIQPLPLETGDMLLLTSDGLYKSVDHDSLLSCIRGSLDETTVLIQQKLLSRQDMMLDNTTFILIKIK